MFKRKPIVTIIALAMSHLAHADLTTDLIASYPFTGNANDISGNGYHGTVHGATLTTDRFGSANAAYSFNNTDNYINANLTTINTTSNSQVTVAFWMYWNGDDNTGAMPIGFVNSDSEIYVLWTRDGYFGFNTSLGEVYGITSSELDNLWVHVVAIFTNGNATQSKLYIDRIAQSLILDGSTPRANSVASNMYLGGFPDDSNCGSCAVWSMFDGKIDDVRVYNRALSDTEVQQLYQISNPTPPTAVTNAASVITPTSAKLSGSINPNGAATSVTFNFGTTTSYGTNIAATPATIAATAGATAVSADKTGLYPATTYHYRVKAVNSAGTTFGANKTFTTTAPAGSVQLENGVALSGQTVASGAWQYYYLTVPSGASNLNFTTSGTGDVDLYTQINAMPNVDNFACSSETNGSAETCTHATPAAGVWWLGIFGYSGGDYSVTASFSQPQTIGAITFNPTSIFVGGTATVSATASSGLTVTFSSTTPKRVQHR
jgi:hypothetical protein